MYIQQRVVLKSFKTRNLKMMYSVLAAIAIAVAPLISAETPLLPLERCSDLLGAECVNGESQCCFIGDDTTGSFVTCVNNAFVQDGCSSGSCDPDPDNGTIECIGGNR